MTDKAAAPKKLEWLEDDAQPKKKRPVGVPFKAPNQSFRDKFAAKTAENILVPIGMMGTIGCLVMGLVEFKRGNSERQQFYMRGRVALQAFSIGAMVLGSYLKFAKQESTKSQ